MKSSSPESPLHEIPRLVLCPPSCEQSEAPGVPPQAVEPWRDNRALESMWSNKSGLGGAY